MLLRSAKRWPNDEGGSHSVARSESPSLCLTKDYQYKRFISLNYGRGKAMILSFVAVLGRSAAANRGVSEMVLVLHDPCLARTASTMVVVTLTPHLPVLLTLHLDLINLLI